MIFVHIQQHYVRSLLTSLNIANENLTKVLVLKRQGANVPTSKEGRFYAEKLEELIRRAFDSCFIWASKSIATTIKRISEGAKTKARKVVDNFKDMARRRGEIMTPQHAIIRFLASRKQEWDKKWLPIQ